MMKSSKYKLDTSDAVNIIISRLSHINEMIFTILSLYYFSNLSYFLINILKISVTWPYNFSLVQLLNYYLMSKAQIGRIVFFFFQKHTLDITKMTRVCVCVVDKCNVVVTYYMIDIIRNKNIPINILNINSICTCGNSKLKSDNTFPTHNMHMFHTSTIIFNQNS